MILTKGGAASVGAALMMILPLATGGLAAFAAPSDFKFYRVEFMPLDRRVPEARAFIAENIRPGMPIQAAIDIVRNAGTACGPAPAHGGVVTCSTYRLQRRPGNDIQDVVWTVKIMAGRDGTVVSTTVSRTTWGV